MNVPPAPRMGDAPRDYVCPFCDGTFLLIERGAADAVCLHSVPPCAMWLRLDTIAFLRAAAAKTEERPS